MFALVFSNRYTTYNNKLSWDHAQVLDLTGILNLSNQLTLYHQLCEADILYKAKW